MSAARQYFYFIRHDASEAVIGAKSPGEEWAEVGSVGERGADQEEFEELAGVLYVEVPQLSNIRKRGQATHPLWFLLRAWPVSDEVAMNHWQDCGMIADECMSIADVDPVATMTIFWRAVQRGRYSPICFRQLWDHFYGADESFFEKCKKEVASCKRLRKVNAP